jgi:hypothetical protein
MLSIASRRPSSSLDFSDSNGLVYSGEADTMLPRFDLQKELLILWLFEELLAQHDPYRGHERELLYSCNSCIVCFLYYLLKYYYCS